MQDRVNTSYVGFLLDLTERVLDGREVTREEAGQLLQTEESTEIQLLLACANRIRQAFHGDRIDFCSIINAKSGKCSEDCSFCAQSAHHGGKSQVYPLLSTEAILEAGKKAVAAGAFRFSIVTSGKGVLNNNDFRNILQAIDELRRQGIRTCASLGLLNDDAARTLKDAGLERYHHNLESARSHYGSICSTHSFQDRVDTVLAAHRAGMEVCSGGILGLGETPAQRIELAFELSELPARSVPINLLNPIPGTPLEHQPLLSALEALKTIAVFRFILPRKELRTCGGREQALRGLQPLMFTAGCSGTMLGNYLTTEGRSPDDDTRDIRDLGLTITTG